MKLYIHPIAIAVVVLLVFAGAFYFAKGPTITITPNVTIPTTPEVTPAPTPTIPAPPEVILGFSKNEVFCNDPVIGIIQSNLPNYACIIYYNKDNTGWTVHKSITLDANGHYSETQTPSVGGSYEWRAICGTIESNHDTVVVTCCRDSDGVDLYTKGGCRDATSALSECCTGPTGGYCVVGDHYDSHVMEFSCMDDACFTQVLACPPGEMCLNAVCRENWGYSEFWKLEGTTYVYMNTYCSPTTTQVSCSWEGGGGFTKGGVNICPTWCGILLGSTGLHTYTCTFTYSDGSTSSYSVDVTI